MGIPNRTIIIHDEGNLFFSSNFWIRLPFWFHGKSGILIFQLFSRQITEFILNHSDPILISRKIWYFDFLVKSLKFTTFALIPNYFLVKSLGLLTFNALILGVTLQDVEATESLRGLPGEPTGEILQLLLQKFVHQVLLFLQLLRLLARPLRPQNPPTACYLKKFWLVSRGRPCSWRMRSWCSMKCFRRPELPSTKWPRR